LGINDAERSQLAQTYSVGKTLWRVPVTHFTPWDFNWPYGPPEGAIEPPEEEPSVLDEDTPDPEDANPCAGCIIEAQSQTLGEEIPIVGTPFKLHYRSDRVLGRKTGNTITIPLSGSFVPSSLQAIELSIDVAGKNIKRTFPAAANLSTTFTWDGLDVYGRAINGNRRAIFRVSYLYEAVYYESLEEFEASFSQLGNATNIVGIRRSTPTIRISKIWEKTISKVNILPSVAGLGAWTLTHQHAFDVFNEYLERGDGNSFRVNNIGGTISTVAGNGLQSLNGDGGPATQAAIGLPRSVALDSAGNMYFFGSNTVRRVGLDGIISTVAGGGTGVVMDGVSATSVQLFGNDIIIAPDDSLYIAAASRVIQVGTDGIIKTVAGTDVSGFSGDGGLATNAQLLAASLDFDSDGSLYIVGDNRIRRVGPDGIITTIAGTGKSGFTGDGGLATEARFSKIRDIAIASNGDLYIADSLNHRIRRIGSDGIVNTVVGTGVEGYNGDGVPALSAQLSFPNSIALDAEGSLYISDAVNYRIRKIDQGGIITTIAGTGVSGFSGDGGSPTAAQFTGTQGIEIAPDDSLYIAGLRSSRVRRISGFEIQDIALGEVLITSRRGDQLYTFDPAGRHNRSIDPVTGALIQDFTYTAEGHLNTITDVDGRITTIQRDSFDNPLSIIAPDGQRTDLALDVNGYLQTVTDPEGNAFNFDYTIDGLMTSRTDPTGNKNTFQYDTLGRLLRDDDPVGGGWNISRIDSATDDSYTVTMASGEDRIRHFTVDPLSNGDSQHTNTAPDGFQTTILFGRDGSEVTTSADGTVSVLTESPDPRFGMMSPVKSLSITTPGGLLNTVASTRTATLLDDMDILSHTTLSENFSLNGKVYSSVYDTATRAWVDTSAEGRSFTRVLDPKGRLLQREVKNIAPVSLAYTEDGRLDTITQDDGSAARTTLMDYYSSGAQQGFLESLTDAEMRQVSFAYDDAGRVTQLTLPDGRQIVYTYDSNGNLSSLTPPGSSTHSFNYTAVDLESQYIPPNLSEILNPETRYDYNRDKQLELITRPDGQTIDYIYNATTGKLTQTVIPQGSYAYSYSGATGQLAQITAPNNGTLNYAYDGSLLLSSTWSGDVSGRVSQSYNNDFQQIQRCANSDCVDFAYDDDLLLIQAGSLAINRDAQKGGLVTSTAINNINTTRTYNAFGELDIVAANDGSSVLYRANYSRDNLGRITQQVETVQGTTTTYDYRYDLAGRLEEIDTNGINTATYGYDSNSNRTLVSGVLSGIFDAQDRLTDHYSTIYTYTANGELQTKLDTVTDETTTYLYDVLGNLRQVTLPDNTQINYDIDGQNLRVGKRINGTVIQGFLYKDQLNPIAELDASGNITSRFVYGSKINVPDYMVRGDTTYRIISNHLGSPRLVVDVSSGNVVQRIDYDEWGEITNDSNPGFQPFGFAGGLYDQHTKLTRFGARDYDPETGRWVAKDPVRFDSGEINLYGYVASDPVNWTDPLGLWSASVSGYAGWGGGISVGQNPVTGKAFIALSVGIGLGGGASFDLNGGGIPGGGGDDPCFRFWSDVFAGITGYMGASIRAGQLNIGIEQSFHTGLQPDGAGSIEITADGKPPGGKTTVSSGKTGFGAGLNISATIGLEAN